MGGFDKKTIQDIELNGKIVLLRADYNVPLVDGKISEAFRIEASLTTIKYLLEKGADKIVIVSHLGRPDGRSDSSLTLKPVAEKLEELLGHQVDFAPDCIGDSAKNVISNSKTGSVVLLENLRFHVGEEANDPDFAQQLVEASGANLFVQDGFGVVHRKHASTDAITKLLPSVSGLLLEKEVETIEQVMQRAARPLVAIVGGAKVSDKIELIERFIQTADCVALTGAMANTFLIAKGQKIAKSFIETDATAISAAKKIMAQAEAAEKSRPFKFMLPSDAVVSTSAKGDKPTRVVDFGSDLADIESYPKLPAESAYQLKDGEMILDIGPASAARIAGAIFISRTVVWNGTCGVTEAKGLAGAEAPFGHGTKTVVSAMIGDSRAHVNRPFTIAGGGDTASYIEQQNLVDDFGFVSTGGGAFLELVAGHKLPGIEALQAKR